MCKLSTVLAAHEGAGYVVAPAGFGKTYLIAESTSLSTGRQLILTHTHAGVNALRLKMRELGVSDRLYHLDTIASWSLRLSLSYSSTSGWNIDRPANNEQWNAMYDACACLLDSGFIRRILCASYAGIYVDEYQDCSIKQHDIVIKLARDLPSRILGDPLQGIFDFAGQNPVDWAHDIEATFKPLGRLDVPHRWIRAGAADLGAWLSEVRKRLEQGKPINLTQGLPERAIFKHVSDNPQKLLQSQGNACRYFNCDARHTVMAVHKGSPEYKAKCHQLSRNLSGRFSSLEEIEGRDLFSFLRRITSARTNPGRLMEVIAFARKCMTAVEANLSAGTIRGEHVTLRTNTKNPGVVQKANEYLGAPTSTAMASFLLQVKRIPQVHVIRADLFNRALGVLRKHQLHPDLSLEEAAEKYQVEFRFRGRPIGRRRLIGTTLLVKGLEFDHAIVLEAASLSKKELYVALTRGARSLTILSTNPELNPAD